MYRIITAEILSSRDPQPSLTSEPRKWVKGFVLGIEPPVALNPDVVSRTFTLGQIGSVGEDKPHETPFNEAVLVGSTDERSTIYIGLNEEVIEGGSLESVRRDLVRTTVHLLGLMGINGYETDREAMPLTDLFG